MAVGDSGKPVSTTALVHPVAFANRVGAHIHKGGPGDSAVTSTVSAPGPTVVNGGAMGPAGRDGDGDGDRQYDWDGDGG